MPLRLLPRRPATEHPLERRSATPEKPPALAQSQHSCSRRPDSARTHRLGRCGPAQTRGANHEHGDPPSVQRLEPADTVCLCGCCLRAPARNEYGAAGENSCGGNGRAVRGKRAGGRGGGVAACCSRSAFRAIQAAGGVQPGCSRPCCTTCRRAACGSVQTATAQGSSACQQAREDQFPPNRGPGAARWHGACLPHGRLVCAGRRIWQAAQHRPSRTAPASRGLHPGLCGGQDGARAAPVLCRPISRCRRRARSAGTAAQAHWCGRHFAQAALNTTAAPRFAGLRECRHA